MKKWISGILLIVLMLFVGRPAVHAVDEVKPLWIGDEVFIGQKEDNPIIIRGDSMGFEISDTVNTFEWSLHKFYPDTIHYLLHLEQSMPVLITTHGSEIRHTSVTVKRKSPEGGWQPLTSNMNAFDYMEMVKMGQAWDYDLCHEDQAMFLNWLPAGHYMIEISGIYTQEQGTSNGPITTTFIGQFAKYDRPNPIPQFLLFGMPYKPWPMLSDINPNKYTKHDFSRYITQEYLMARREFDGNVYFELNVPTTLDISFSTRGKPTLLTITGEQLHGDTIFCGHEERRTERLKAGRYLIGARDSVKINPDTYVEFTVESQPAPDWLKYTLRDPYVESSNYVSTMTSLSADGSLFAEDRKYFDGIGREVLNLNVEGSPSGNNIASLTEYDANGRIYRQYLPGISSGYYANFNDIDFTSVYNSNGYCYSKTIYDSTPLDRVSSVTGAGAQWHKSDISTFHDYDLNQANKASHAAFRYEVTDTPDAPGVWPSVSCTARYADAELSVHTTVDEDSRKVLEFTDAQGHQVLRRVDMGDGTWANTYYLYDNYGNLTAVLPPEASARMAYFGTWNGNSDETLTSLAYLYRFDRRGRLVARQEPGPVIEEYRYDTTNRQVLSRDGNLADRGLWRFAICDNLGRQCLAGLCKDITWDGVQSGSNIPMVRAKRSNDPAADALMGYELQGFALSDAEILEAFYYDDYSFVGQHGFPNSEVMGFRESGGFGSRYPDARGQLTGHAVALLDSVAGSSTSSSARHYIYAATYYDSRDRAIQSISTNHLGGIDRTLTAYDFAGRAIKNETAHTAPDYSGESEIVNQWQRSYDNRGRELTVTHRLGRQGEWQTLSSKSYDAIGRLSADSRGQAVNLSYGYDIRSRLTAISSRHYNQTLAYTLGGNVSRMSWWAYCPDDAEKTYNYSYDALGRLVAADYSDTKERGGAFSTAYSYDLNGNILSLSRMGVYDYYRGRVQYGLIDELTLTYSSNRLQSVSDLCYGPFYQGAYHFVDGADEAVEYTYDANGNTDADLNRGVTHTAYDINNRPRSVEFADGSLTSYIYDATGLKLRTVHNVAQLPVAMPSVGSSSSVRRSVTDYCGAYVYEDSLLSRINLEGGYLSFTDHSGNHITEPEYHYYLTDHLGNNRMDVTDDGSVWQAMDYYPFGMPMASSYMPGAQRWLFGGKELDRTGGLDLYDQEARAYDPTLGRFRNPDPLASKYTSLSPYLFCAANPMLLIDPDGKKVELFATTLPDAEDKWKETGATHTFIVVTDSENVQHYFAYGADGDPIKTAAGYGGHLKQKDYKQDHDVYSGKNTKDLKVKITVDPPEGMSQDDFDNKVIETANSFGENINVKYRVDGGEFSIFNDFGNCNTSTFTILFKSGVKVEQLKKIKAKIHGFSVGFSGNPMPWTQEEQRRAVKKARIGRTITAFFSIPTLILHFLKKQK